MMCIVLDIFKAQTNKGNVELQVGQKINLPEDSAYQLFKENKVCFINEEDRYRFEERAGIMQYQADLSKEGAETLTWCREVCMLTKDQAEICEVAKPCLRYARDVDAKNALGVIDKEFS